MRLCLRLCLPVDVVNWCCGEHPPAGAAPNLPVDFAGLPCGGCSRVVDLRRAPHPPTHPPASAELKATSAFKFCRSASFSSSSLASSALALSPSASSATNSSTCFKASRRRNMGASENGTEPAAEPCSSSNAARSSDRPGCPATSRRLRTRTRFLPISNCSCLISESCSPLSPPGLSFSSGCCGVPLPAARGGGGQRWRAAAGSRQRAAAAGAEVLQADAALPDAQPLVRLCMSGRLRGLAGTVQGAGSGARQAPVWLVFRDLQNV